MPAPRLVIAATLLTAACLAGAAAETPGRRGGAPSRGVETTVLPRDSEVFEQTRSLLTRDFRVSETRRFVVLSDADPRWTQDQAERLERTHHQFQRFVRRLGIEPAPLEHKLVCVLFENRDDYRNFARMHDGVRDTWIAGYYAPRRDRIVFYHGDANPSVQQARARLREMEDEIKVLSRDARAAQRQGHALAAEALRRREVRYQTHLRTETGRVDDFASQVNTATLVHEAIHQLLFHTGVQTAGVEYPVWISEGLATTFETEATNGSFGPAHEYEPRRAAFTSLLHNDGLIDLRALIALADVPDDEHIVHAVYNQSYAFVTWLARFRRDELRTYLELAGAEPRGPISASRAITLFEQAFGDIERLERSWRRHEQGALDDLTEASAD